MPIAGTECAQNDTSPIHLFNLLCLYGPLLLQVTTLDSRTMHINGPPATCANLALHSLVPDVDFVVSGPNVGHNVGRYGLSGPSTLSDA